MRRDEDVTLWPSMAFWMVSMAAAYRFSIRSLEHAREDIDQLVDLLLFDDERRRERDDVTGGADEEAALERLDEARVGALRWLAGDGIELDGADQPDIANVDDVRKALERVDRVLPIRRKLRRARQQSLLLIGLQRGDAGCAGDRVAGVGIAMEEIDDLLRDAHERVVDLRLHEHRAHRNSAVGYAFRRRDDVGRDAEIIGAERRAKSPKGGDDLIEDEQDVVLGTDRGEALQVTFGRDENAGRAGDGLDDDGGDGRGVVQRHETLEIVGKLGAMLGLAAAEGVAVPVVGVANMVDAGEKGAEPLAVVGDAADRGAAEIDAVIAALATDQADFRRIAFCPVIGERHLQRGLDGLRTRVGKEHVVEARWGDIDELRGALEGPRMAQLEGAGEIELANLLANGLDDLRPAMAGIDAPQSGRTVEHAASVVCGVVRAFGADQQARRLLILAIRRERHPECFEIVRREPCAHVSAS